MANAHDEFKKFYDEIRLKKANRDSLMSSRNANRDRIRKHFRDTLKRTAPKFHGQGSYAMSTGVEPLDDEDYDVDDGVYLQDLGTDTSKWPRTETVHGWIIDAVSGSTSETPKSKARCVRVRYQADYHVDLPCYALDAQGHYRIFEKGKSDHPVSNAKDLKKWWDGQVSGKPQLRRMVRSLKAWRDFKNAISSTASGLALTILAANHYRCDDRDDVAFVNTVEAIYEYLNAGNDVTKPVAPFDNLSARWSDSQRTAFISRLKTLKEKGQSALDKEKLSDATDLWRGQFGERFPKVEEKEAKSQGPARVTSAPAVLGNDGRSA